MFLWHNPVPLAGMGRKHAFCSKPHGTHSWRKHPRSPGLRLWCPLPPSSGCLLHGAQGAPAGIGASPPITGCQAAQPPSSPFSAERPAANHPGQVPTLASSVSCICPCWSLSRGIQTSSCRSAWSQVSRDSVVPAVASAHPDIARWRHHPPASQPIVTPTVGDIGELCGSQVCILKNLPLSLNVHCSPHFLRKEGKKKGGEGKRKKGQRRWDELTDTSWTPNVHRAHNP